MRIHPSALIDPSAELDPSVEVGAYSIIGPHVNIAADTVIASHVVIEARVIVGQRCQIHPMAVIGGAPQDTGYKQEPTRVRIGSDTIIREGVTLHRASGEGAETIVGDGCFLMANSHVAHNCKLANRVIMANASLLAGYCEVGDDAFLGGGVLIHQHCRIGKRVMMPGGSGILKDAPPFALMSAEAPSHPLGLNLVGLKRQGVSLEDRTLLKRAYRLLFFSGLHTQEGVRAVRETLPETPYITELLEFIESSKRGITKARFKNSLSESAEQKEYVS
jgi:UDP-N-acetylglucosamine acyltransferase